MAEVDELRLALRAKEEDQEEDGPPKVFTEVDLTERLHQDRESVQVQLAEVSNLKKKLKKEEDNRKAFSELARKKEEETKRIQLLYEKSQSELKQVQETAGKEQKT